MTSPPTPVGDPREPIEAGDISTDDVLAETSRRVRASRRLIAELDDRLRASERVTRMAAPGQASQGPATR